jgi:hypothetical protein
VFNLLPLLACPFLPQVEELQAALALEQTAHQHAVKQYVDALDAKSAMQLQLQEAQQQLQDLAGVYAQLQQQHQELSDHYSTLLGQCKAVRLCINNRFWLRWYFNCRLVEVASSVLLDVITLMLTTTYANKLADPNVMQVRDVFQHVDSALALDSELVQQVKELEHQQQPPLQLLSPNAADNSSSCDQAVQESADASSPLPAAAVRAAVAVDHAEDLQPLAEHLRQQVQVMHAQWRLALDARTAAITDNYRMGDELREARTATHQAGQALAEMQREHARVQGQLESSQV